MRNRKETSSGEKKGIDNIQRWAASERQKYLEVRISIKGEE
jgi:hypothetical protein